MTPQVALKYEINDLTFISVVLRRYKAKDFLSWKSERYIRRPQFGFLIDCKEQAFILCHNTFYSERYGIIIIIIIITYFT